jgi:hypothetical protein
MTEMSMQPADLPLRDYVPRSQLCVKETQVSQPRFPVIDAHLQTEVPICTQKGGWLSLSPILVVDSQ